MSEFKLQERIRLSPLYVLDVFQYEGRLWAVTQNLERYELRCWSRKNETADVHQLAAALRQRLSEMKDYDALLFYFDGWRTWSGDVPVPIASLSISGNLERARAELVSSTPLLELGGLRESCRSR